MSFAVAVEHGGLRVIAKSHCAVLMGDRRQWQSLPQIKIPRKQTLMALMAMNITVRLLHSLLQLCLQPIVALDVVQFVADANLAITIDSHAVIWVR